MLKKTQLAGALLLTGTLFLVGGCGYKTEPVPPDSIVPKAINDLRYSVSEKGVTLRWTFPKETIRGSDLTDISTFDVYRAVVPLSDYCPTCPIPFNEAIQVAGGLIDLESNRQGTYETSLLRSGHKYFFKVHARTSWWAASADSNIVSFVWHTPAKGPEGVSAKAGDTSATISWQSVTTLMDGQQTDYPLSYQVLRSKDNKEFAAIGESTSKTQFVDNGLLNGETYYFKVQSILDVDKNAISGGVSASISVVPIDLTPPSAPAGVTAVQTGAGIKIFWDKSKDADVEGYRIYRRGGKDSVAKKIGEVPAVYAIFEDTNVDSGTSYYYTVTAYDKAETPNESVRSREASIRH
jgi:hypothetical protein